MSVTTDTKAVSTLILAHGGKKEMKRTVEAVFANCEYDYRIVAAPAAVLYAEALASPLR